MKQAVVKLNFIQQPSINLYQYSQMNSNRMIVCLNPKCPFPSNRICQEDTDIYHKKCHNWKIYQGSISHSEDQLCSPLKSLGLSFNFENQGINAIDSFLQQKMWPKKIHDLFDQVKQRIISDLQQIEAQKLKQFQQLFKKASIAYQHISEVKKNLSSQKWRNIKIEMKKIQQLGKTKFLNLFQRYSLNQYYQKSIKNQLKTIGQLIQSTQPTPDQLDEIRKLTAIDKANEYFFDNNQITINDKIMKLSTILKNQMVKTTFDSKLGLYQANCWFCKTGCYSPKEDPTRLACLQQFLQHLVKSHAKQVYLNFMSKVIKYQVDEISLSSLNLKVLTSKISLVTIVDRENAGAIERPIQLQQQSLWVEVVNKDNINLAKGLYLSADSKRKDAADILMTIAIYELIKAGVNKVVLITKDHFGVTLMQLLNKTNKGQVQCIEPKDFLQMAQQKSKKQIKKK